MSAPPVDLTVLAVDALPIVVQVATMQAEQLEQAFLRLTRLIFFAEFVCLHACTHAGRTSRVRMAHERVCIFVCTRILTDHCVVAHCRRAYVYMSPYMSPYMSL